MKKEKRMKTHGVASDVPEPEGQKKDTGAAAPSVTMTALWVAHMRAEETKGPNPLIEDSLAEALAGEDGAKFAELYEKVAERAYGKFFDPVVRAKYIEDIIARKNGEMKQIVLLGAGMDTRAFRLHGVHEDTTIFEVDFAQSFDRKHAVIEMAGARALCKRVTVPVDFGTMDGGIPSWISALLDAGFDPHEKSIITAEGLLMYLKNAEVSALLSGLSQLACFGSIVVGDALNQALLQWELAQPVLSFMAENDAPWIYGFPDLSTWRDQWADHSFELTTEKMSELASRYKRPERISTCEKIGLIFNVLKNRMLGRIDEVPAHVMFVATKKRGQ